MTNYNDQVFINCPFDSKYSTLFHACVFTVLDAGFVPRCSLEVDDATQFRLNAIVTLINDCRYGIHDLSRVQFDAGSKLPRFNMPFELGLFYSAKHFGGTKQKKKQCLVFETDKYRYQKFISDIAGIDVTPHKNSSEKLIVALRNWLVTASRRTTVPPGKKINERFNIFRADMKKVCRKNAADFNAMPFVERVQNMSDWLKINQLTHSRLFTP